MLVTERNSDCQPKEGLVADKSSQLILTVLSHAAAAAGPLPLFGTKSVPGLFPGNATGKQAAQRCQDEGYLCPTESTPESCPAEESSTPVVVATRKKAPTAPLYSITDKGLTYLLGQVSPRQVLEDFVRALESRRKQADDLLNLARQMQHSIDAFKASAEKVLHHFSPPDQSKNGSLKALFRSFLQQESDAPPTGARSADPSRDTLPDLLLAELTRWQTTSTSEDDCPLPHLYRQLPAKAPGCTIGQFHDALRQLGERGKIYLHPWSGPLYDIPEPPYALLIGHEVAYYASLRRDEA
jgi:hypothetical protein